MTEGLQVRPFAVTSVYTAPKSPIYPTMDLPQELNETVGGKLSEFILQINNCYPPEVVEYYSPNYSKTLLQKIDEYQPAM